jgi:hypothetical protein
MSLLNFQHLNQQIKDKLFEIAYKINCFNKSGDIDISRYAEAYFRLLLNVIYKDKNWFFEKATKINQDTYDLYDKENHVCIQITSNSRNTKKADTLKSFEVSQKKNGFNTLIILFIADSKPKADKIIRSFSYEDYNIQEFCGLIEAKCKQRELLEIRDILNEKLDLASSTPQKKLKKEKVSQREFLRRKKIETELKKELVIADYWNKIDREKLAKDPFWKFKDSRFILRSISDETYPGGGENANWSRTFMYDFYVRGILIDFGACIHYYAAIDTNNSWYILDYEERDKELPEGFKKEQIRILGKLPYKNIIYWQDGDEYYNDYHLFCEYNGINNSPYEEIIYLREGGGYYWDELEKDKKIER